MASDVGTFGLSLAVSAITIIFTSSQAAAVTRTLERHYRGVQGTTSVDDVAPQTRPLHESPELTKAWITQALDVATNFPAAILTIVAFTQLTIIPTGAFWIFLVAAVLITLGTVWLANPRLVGPYVGFTVWGVSAYSVLLVVANVVGFVLALV